MNLPVSIVIPMYNAEKYIESVLDAILSQNYDAPIEVIVVNDGSTDRSLEIVKRFLDSGVKIIDQENQGAVKATNNGFQEAKHDFLCSIDSDVVLHQGWFSKVMPEFDDNSVAAVQGYYKTAPNISFLARMMGYDVEARYDAIESKVVTQVCTGDTVYRKSAIEEVGLFDPGFTYGYDNDMSYRLQNSGYKLIFKKDALCDHYWKADFMGYVRQQYRSAFGRMQLIKKHKNRTSGDSVSGLRMILQVPLTMSSLLFLVLGLILSGSAVGSFLLLSSMAGFGIMLADRMFFSATVFRKQKDLSVIFLPLVYLLRNLVWVWAFLSWGGRLLWIK